jgi:xyloglucan-specific exo-beta-1,4-glucanase
MKKYILFVLTTLLSLQTLAQYTWSNVAMGGGGFVSGIITSKKQAGLIYARTDVGGAYRWDAANSKWIALTDFASDSQSGIFGVESVAIDPQNPGTVYMSTGISYFNNGKSSILRSTDYGATFTITDVTAQFKVNGNGNGRQDGERLQVDPGNSSILYCGSRANGLFQSTDAGSIWSRLSGLNVLATPNGNGINFVVPDSSSIATLNGVKKAQRIFVGVSRTGNNNLYRSVDGGITFTAIPNPNTADTTQMPHRAVLSGNGYLYVTYSNGAGPGGTTAEPCTTGAIWKYNIAANTWTNVTPLTSSNLINKPYCGLSIDPNNPNRLIASTVNNYSYQYGNVYGDKIYYSTDAGATWTDIVSRGFSLNANGIPWVTGQSIHWAGCIQFDPSNTNRVFINSGNGVFINNDITNAAGIWNFATAGLEETVPQNVVSIPGGPLISVIGDYDGFTQNDPSQYAAQRHTPSMGSTSGLDYAVISKKVVRVATSIYYSTDQGITWIKTNTINGSSGQVALSADGNTYLHCPNGSTTTYRSTDNGSTWTTVTGLSVSSARPVADGANSGKFYAYNTSNGALMVSADGGVSFTTGAIAGTGGSKVIRTIPGREGHVWVALYNGGLTHTEDSGVSFIKSTNVSYCAAVGIGKALVIGGYETIFIYGTVNGTLGIFSSTDKGATWTRINDDAHQYGGPGNAQFVQGDMNTFGRVYMSTAGRGIAYGSIVNHPPTDIALSSTSIIQNNAVGDLVGNLTSTDQDSGSTFTYALVSGTGSDDNASFSVSGARLNAGIIFNYNTKQSYNVRIRTTDNGGLSFEKAFVITIQNAFTLPVNNFTVLVTNETCSNNNDGKISITAVQSLNYQAVLTVNGVTTSYPFNTSLTVPSLSAGTYSLCINVVGQPNFQQCYSLSLTEPKPLSVYIVAVKGSGNMVLNFSGASLYQVQLNDKTYTTTANSITLPFANGVNTLTVSTDKACQGVFKKNIFVNGDKSAYPNPFESTLAIDMGTDVSRTAVIKVFGVNGALFYSKAVTVNNGTIPLDLSALKSGVYMIDIKTGIDESSIKIIKK